MCLFLLSFNYLFCWMNMVAIDFAWRYMDDDVVVVVVVVVTAAMVQMYNVHNRPTVRNWLGHIFRIPVCLHFTGSIGFHFCLYTFIDSTIVVDCCTHCPLKHSAIRPKCRLHFSHTIIVEHHHHHQHRRIRRRYVVFDCEMDHHHHHRY